MSHTQYDDSIAVALDGLGCLASLLKTAEKEHCNATSLPEARLHSDMKPLFFQVEAATLTAVKILERLSGCKPVELPSLSSRTNAAAGAGEATSDSKMGEGVTFADMYARIELAQRALRSVERETIDGRTDEPIMLPSKAGGPKKAYSGHAFLFGWALPNLFFHVSMAYAILRKEGVPLGKDNWLSEFGQRFDQD